MLKIFSLKQKANEILPAAIEKNQIMSLQEKTLYVPSDYNL